MIEYTLIRFHEESQKRLADLQRQSDMLAGLGKERSMLKAKAQLLVDTVAAAGHSTALLSALAGVEGQIADLDHRIDSSKPIDVAATVEEIRDFAYRNVMNLRILLHLDASESKVALTRHIGQLIMKPKQTATGPVYEVSGRIRPSESRCNAGGVQGRT